MIAFANGFSHPGKFARVALTEWGSTPHTSTLAKVCASVKNSRAGCCASANALFRERRGFEINSRPARARTHASPGQGNEFGRTIECIAHSIAGRFDRRARQRAKHPGKAVPWVLRLSRSLLLRGGEKYDLEGCSVGRFHHTDFVHAAASNIHPPVGRCRHVTHCTSSRGDIRAGKLFRLWIEPDDGVRLHSGFAVPNQTVWRDSDSVGTGARSARRRPHPDVTCHGIKSSQISTLVVREIDFVASVDCNAAWPRVFRQLVFGDLHGLRIDLG